MVVILRRGGATSKICIVEFSSQEGRDRRRRSKGEMILRRTLDLPAGRWEDMPGSQTLFSRNFTYPSGTTTTCVEVLLSETLFDLICCNVRSGTLSSS